MQYRTMSRTGPHTSQIGFGTVEFGADRRIPAEHFGPPVAAG